MGVIYKILKQQRQQQQQQQQMEKQMEQQQMEQQRRSLGMELNIATKCKVHAAIKQRQLLRQEQQEQRDQQDHDDTLAEQQLQQLCRFLAENAARKKRQRLKLHQECSPPAEYVKPLPLHESATHPAAGTHDMDLLMEQLSTCNDPTTPTNAASSGSVGAPGAPRVSILLKIRHQIFERKRQRQRQLAELVKQRMVVWRPW